MAEEAGEFQALMRRIQAGDKEAVRELIAVYGPHILRVVRRRLHQRLRSRFDSTDFQQSVWGSFFALPLEKLSFENPESLLVYLIRMARNKVVDAIRRQRGNSPHEVGRDKSLDGSAAAEVLSLSNAEPSPSRVLMAQEELQLRTQDPSWKRVQTLLRQGYSQEDIARVMRVNRKRVQRIVHDLELDFLS